MPQMNPHNWIIPLFLVMLIINSLSEMSLMKTPQKSKTKKLTIKKLKMTW